MPAHFAGADIHLAPALVVADDLHQRRIGINLRHLLPSLGLGLKGLAHEVTPGLLPDRRIGGGPEIHPRLDHRDQLTLPHRSGQRLGQLQRGAPLGIKRQWGLQRVDMPVSRKNDIFCPLCRLRIACRPSGCPHLGGPGLSCSGLALNVGTDMRGVLGHRAMPVAVGVIDFTDLAEHRILKVAGHNLEWQTGCGDPLQARLGVGPRNEIPAPLLRDEPTQERHDMVTGIDVVHHPVGQKRPMDARFLARPDHVIVGPVVHRPS